MAKRAPTTKTTTRTRTQRTSDVREIAPKKTTKTVVQPSLDDIRTRAYALFEARAGGPSDPVADWLEAERQLRA